MLRNLDLSLDEVKAGLAITGGRRQAIRKYEQFLRDPPTYSSKLDWQDMRRELIAVCFFCGQGRRHETLMAAYRHRERFQKHICPRGKARERRKHQSVLRAARLIR